MTTGKESEDIPEFFKLSTFGPEVFSFFQIGFCLVLEMGP